MKSIKLVKPLFAAVVLMIGLAGCQKKEPLAEKGPAEKAGQQIDQAAAKARDETSKATEKAGQQIEKAGEKIQDAAKDAQSK